MFVLHVSCLPVLWAVAQHCRLSYVGTIREVTPNGCTLYGIEVQLPALFVRDTPRCVFFWSSPHPSWPNLYDDAAFQAVKFLQTLYGFTVADFTYYAMVCQQNFVSHLFSIANRGATLARMVVTTMDAEPRAAPEVIYCAEQLLRDLDTLLNPVVP